MYISIIIYIMVKSLYIHIYIMVLVKLPLKNSYILMVPSLPLLWLKSSWARPTSTSTSGLAHRFLCPELGTHEARDMKEFPVLLKCWLINGYTSIYIYPCIIIYPWL